MGADMQLSARHTQLPHRWRAGDGRVQKIASRTLRKLQEPCTTDSLAARLAASVIFAAAILLAAYLAVRLPLDL